MQLINRNKIRHIHHGCIEYMVGLDTTLCVQINRSSKNNAIKSIFRIISRLGDGVFWYSLMALMLISYGDSAINPVLHMLSAGLLGTLIYKWLKSTTSRPRPYEVHQDVWLTGRPLDKFSFPSGHTLHAVVFTTVLGFYYPLLMCAIIPFTILVGLSRVILGLHYPSDVLVGAGIGYSLAYLSQYLIYIAH